METRNANEDINVTNLAKKFQQMNNQVNHSQVWKIECKATKAWKDTEHAQECQEISCAMEMRQKYRNEE